jgi:hypothetical protein
VINELLAEDPSTDWKKLAKKIVNGKGASITRARQQPRT